MTAIGSLAILSLLISYKDSSHHLRRVTQIEVSFDISLDFNTSKKSA
jgi:hypothetical protein